MGNTVFLLFEAEPVISDYIHLALESAGFVTYCAGNSGEALDLCARYQPKLALLNFHPDGLAFADQLKKQYNIKCGFITGSRQKDIAAAANFSTEYPLLHKPFTPVQLKKMIVQMLP